MERPVLPEEVRVKMDDRYTSPLPEGAGPLEHDEDRTATNPAVGFLRWQNQRVVINVDAESFRTVKTQEDSTRSSIVLDSNIILNGRLS